VPDILKRIYRLNIMIMKKTDMLYFACDYMEGAHENILRKLLEINLDLINIQKVQLIRLEKNVD